ncbi:protein CapI, partial [Vibrio parahaemolyticus]
QTYADTTAFYQATGYRPSVSVEEGIAEFVAWYRNFYNK